MTRVALEDSRGLTEAETNKFYWMETLENYGEGTFIPGGDSKNSGHQTIPPAFAYSTSYGLRVRPPRTGRYPCTFVLYLDNRDILF
jgi:hypothetical protein